MIEAGGPSTEEVAGGLFRDVPAPPGVGMFAPPEVLRNASRAKSEGRAKGRGRLGALGPWWSLIRTLSTQVEQSPQPSLALGAHVEEAAQDRNPFGGRHLLLFREEFVGVWNAGQLLGRYGALFEKGNVGYGIESRKQYGQLHHGPARPAHEMS